MVWGGICGQQRTDLIVVDGNLTAHRYINQVLRPVLLPFLQHQTRLVSTGQCLTSQSSCGATVLRRKRPCFAMASPFTRPVTDRTFVVSNLASEFDVVLNHQSDIPGRHG